MSLAKQIEDISVVESLPLPDEVMAWVMRAYTEGRNALHISCCPEDRIDEQGHYSCTVHPQYIYSLEELFLAHGLGPVLDYFRFGLGLPDEVGRMG